MRLIDADELIKDRVENDPVRIAAECAPTAFDKEKVLEEFRREITLTKALLARAKSRVEKAQRKNEISRKEAVARGDTKTELALSEKIGDYNTILWALEVAHIAAKDGAFGSHIMERFTRVH